MTDNTANNSRDHEHVKKIAEIIDEHKGEETVILDVHASCGFADYFIITTARSSRHLTSLRGYIIEFLKKNNLQVLNNSHRSDETGWILIDCGSFIVHLMEHQERYFYELEKLWFQGKTLPYSSKSS